MVLGTCWGLNVFGEDPPPSGTFTHVSAGLGDAAAVVIADINRIRA